MAKGFCTFSSCDGGDGHSFTKRTIRICVDRPTVDDPYGGLISRVGERECFTRFLDLCDFVECQRWTYCSVRLINTYIFENNHQ